MTWRLFAVFGALSAALVVNGWLLFQENIDRPEAGVEIDNARRDPLLNLSFTPQARARNFEDFGLPEDLRRATMQESARLSDRYRDQLRELLEESAEHAVGILCPNDVLPQRYAALELLAVDQNGTLQIVDASRAFRLERQPWYLDVPVPEIYETLELAGTERRPDATAMGVAAILLGRQEDVFTQATPWGSNLLGGGWGMARLEKMYPEVIGPLVEYFALMHVLTEIANEPGGLCSS